MSHRNLLLSKLFIFFILIGLFDLTTGIQSLKCPNQEKIKNVIVKKVEFNVLTFAQVKCDNFENSFGERIETISLNKEQIKLFKFIFENLILAETNEELDVRAKIFISKCGGKVDTVCIDPFGVSINNLIYEQSDELVEFISKLK